MLRAVRSISIEKKLPLFISVLLMVAIIALSVSAVRGYQRLAIATARARLETVADQFATSSSDGYRRLITAAAARGRNDTLLRAVRDPSPATRAAALRMLAKLAADTASVLGVRMLDAAGRVVLELGNTARLRGLGPAPTTRRDSAAVSALVQRDTTIAWAIVAPLTDGGRVIGRLEEWQRLNTSARAKRVIGQVVGLDATVYFGNPSGDVWFDLAGQNASPPPGIGAKGGFVEYDRPGAGRQLASVRPMAVVPWMIEVDFPRSSVLKAQGTFLNRLAWTAAAVLLVGGLCGWLASWRFTHSLRDLTAGAEAIAKGDFSVNVREIGTDEIGRLASAFTVMKDKVKTTQEGLETQVASQTAELRTAMKTIEDTRDELVRKERLAILGQLSSGVGHELRNPLGVMNNAVYYLEAVLTNPAPTVAEYLGILKNQIALSEKIVSDLLDFARIKKPDRQAVPLERMIAETLKTMPPPANVRTVTQLAPEVPAVLADPVHVMQILNNLASNAYQAMGTAGGTVTIRVTPDGPGNVQIEVSDTGPGIAPENLGKIFEPLFTTKARGIGLGLAVSRSLAATNGGALTVASASGSGATFRLVLPEAPKGVPA